MSSGTIALVGAASGAEPRLPSRGSALSRLRKRREARKRRGVALVMVLGAITVLTVLLTELQEETSSELSSALAERDAIRAEYYARSAVNLSRLIIASEPGVRKSLGVLATAMKIKQLPVWEYTDLLLGPFNSEASSGAFTAAMGATADYSSAMNLGLSGGGRFEVKIVDEDSKININTAARGDPASQLRVAAALIGLFAPTSNDPLFEGRDLDNQFSDRAIICGALIDWADSDEALFGCDPRATGPSSGGTEDNFYQVIGMPYIRKNAAYDSLQELRLVRGVGDDFWATFVDPDPGDPRRRIMTVWGQGAVNISSANAQTLLAIACAGAPDSELCNDPAQLESFLAAVTLFKNMMPGVPLFSSTNDFIQLMQGKGMLGPLLGSLGVKPVTFKSPNDVKKGITTKSKVFSIYADGVVPGNKKTTRIRIHAVVDFRKAKGIGAASMGIAGSTPTAVQTATGDEPPPNAVDAAAAAALAGTPEAYASALQKNPAGTVVYWRVE
jgi:general secretion pathway protein K